MVEIADDVVIDAMSRAICAVIADAVKDERKAKETGAGHCYECGAGISIPEGTCSKCYARGVRKAYSDDIQRKQDAKAAEDRRLAEQVAWANVMNDERRGASPKRREYTDEQIQSRIDADIEEFMPCQGPAMPGFISKNKPAMTVEQAMQVAAMRRSKECPSQPHGHSPEDRFYRSDVPQFTTEEVRSAMQPSVPDPVVATPPAIRPMSTRAEDYCRQCHADMSYADPSQTLCYGCRST
jgi:hypothetical protein